MQICSLASGFPCWHENKKKPSECLKNVELSKKTKWKVYTQNAGHSWFWGEKQKPWFLRHAHNTPRCWPIKKSCQKYSAFSQALMAAEKLTSLGRTLAAGILRNNSTAHCHCHAFASAFKGRNFGNVSSSSGSLDIQIFLETCGEKAWHFADPNIFSGNIWISFWGTNPRGHLQRIFFGETTVLVFLVEHCSTSATNCHPKLVDKLIN